MSLPPQRKRQRPGIRTALASVAVVALVTGATATAGLLEVQTFVDDISSGAKLDLAPGVISTVDVGRPQTILLLGSDRRFKAGKSDARSDTIMLVRLDADAQGTAVMNIPRDLKVKVPVRSGRFETTKINSTYSIGGPGLTAKVVKDVLGVQINHIINVNFGGFRRAVDYIDCVYADVDRRYFNDNSTAAYGAGYATINIPAGYQKLCGQKALDYVRFRHMDTDIVRSARQQDFLRQAQQQYGVQQAVQSRHELTKIFGAYTQTDADLHSVDALLKLMSLVAFSSQKNIVSVPFPAILPNSPTDPYVTADPVEIKKAVAEFLGQSRAGRPVPHPKPKPGDKFKPKPSKVAPAPVFKNLDRARNQADLLKGIGIPVYAPKLMANGSRYMGPTAGQYPRAYVLRDPDGKKHVAYRIVATTNGIGQYYGVQGTSWTDPPLLASPSATKTIKGGRQLLLFGDGRRLRFVGFKTPKGSYWVSNTLTETLSNRTMIAIAASLVPLAH